MRRMFLMILVLGAVGSFAFGQAYGACADPATACEYYFPGSTPTGFCGYEACFEMNYGPQMRLLVIGGSNYPRQWLTWHEGQFAGGGSCILRKDRQLKHFVRTTVEIPSNAPNHKCRVDLVTPDHLYHEEFVSNPASGCLAWLECKEQDNY